MTRIKGGILHTKRRRGILKHTKGYKWGRKSKIKLAKTAKMKAGQHAFESRREKKRTRRNIWQIKINAAARKHDISYSKLIGGLKKKNIDLDRKILSTLAQQYQKAFKHIVELVKK
jgi:large subunit ribosomal protein L20